METRICKGGCRPEPYPLTGEYFRPTVVLNGKQYFHNYCHDCRRARTREQDREKRRQWQDPGQFQMCSAKCSKNPLPIEDFPMRKTGSGEITRRKICTKCWNAVRRAASVASQIPLSELVCNWKDALRCNQCPHVATDYHALFRHKHEAHSSLPYGLGTFSITPSTLGAFADECG